MFFWRLHFHIFQCFFDVEKKNVEISRSKNVQFRLNYYLPFRRVFNVEIALEYWRRYFDVDFFNVLISRRRKSDVSAGLYTDEYVRFDKKEKEKNSFSSYHCLILNSLTFILLLCTVLNSYGEFLLNTFALYYWCSRFYIQAHWLLGSVIISTKCYIYPKDLLDFHFYGLVSVSAKRFQGDSKMRIRFLSTCICTLLRFIAL